MRVAASCLSKQQCVDLALEKRYTSTLTNLSQICATTSGADVALLDILYVAMYPLHHSTTLADDLLSVRPVMD